MPAGNLSPNMPWMLANPRWAALINPVLANLLIRGQMINAINVKSGANTINHGLGRKLIGYFVTLNSANATFYDSQASNQRPELTLILNASAPATINLWVF